TVGDFAAQAVTARLLSAAFPGETLVGEESAEALRKPDAATALRTVTGFVEQLFPDTSQEEVCDWIDQGWGEPCDRYWTLDPIDGTKGFLRGDQYAVAFALMEDGQPRVAAMGCPNLTLKTGPRANQKGAVFLATAGEGAFVGGMDSDSPLERLQVSPCDHPKEARLLGSYESGHTNDDQLDRFVESLGSQAEMVRLDSQAKYGLLAAGEGELLIRFLSASRPDYKEKIWDHAAGSLVVTEAGGTVSDLDGKPLDFTQGRSLEGNRGVLVSNGSLHERALEAIRSISA
ncbi:MAG: 3'(2'),5'-bisphosphate nucleotidase, partial [Planctomycetales bacterium]